MTLAMTGPWTLAIDSQHRRRGHRLLPGSPTKCLPSPLRSGRGADSCEEEPTPRIGSAPPSLPGPTHGRRAKKGIAAYAPKI